MEMLLVRHGRPATGGGADPGLADEGRRAADRLGEHLASGAVARPEAVWSSPMRRAVQTADVVAERLGVGVRLDERLREFDDGAESYVAADDAPSAEERAELWRALETGVWGEHRFDPRAFQARVRAAFDDVVAQHPGGVVAVVCHSGVINAYACTVLGRPRGMFCHLEHTSFSRVLASGRGERQLNSLNETAHLQTVRASSGT